jgi:hypothetical protein
MEFTFGIITDGTQDIFLQLILNSIYEENIPHYEVIIVGNTEIKPNEHLRVIPFDETVKSMWITRKKNIISLEAKYENIVFLHDYVRLEKRWYAGFLQFGNEFQFCTNKIQNINGDRYNDYCLYLWYMLEIDTRFQLQCLLPYDFKPTYLSNKLTYIPGYYYIIKKNLALQYPLDERKGHTEGEDIDLSYSLTHNNIMITCNSYSTVKFLKDKGKLHFMNEITSPLLEKIYTLTEDDVNKWKQNIQYSFVFKQIRDLEFKLYKFIYIERFGGLGNQLFQYTAGLTAATYHKVPLLYSKETVNHHNLKKIKYASELFSYGNETTLSLKEIPIFSKGGFEPWSPSEVSPNLIMSGYFQYYPAIKEMIPVVCNMLIERLSARRIRMATKYAVCTDAIFIHIRRGDYLENPTFHYVHGQEYYESAYRLLIEKIKAIPSQIFILSDDLSWCKQQSWLLALGNCIFVDENELDSLAFMSLIQRGAIIANSTFSWWGVMFHPDMTVIYPRKWIFSIVFNLFPENWIPVYPPGEVESVAVCEKNIGYIFMPTDQTQMK